MIFTFPYRASGGFTLLELIITLAVAGLFAGIGLPAMSDWLASQRLRAQTHVLWRDLDTARQAAVLRNEIVVVCPSSDGNRCTRSYDWSDGWISFANLDDDNPVQRDMNEPIIAHYRGDEQLRTMANRYAFRFSGDLRRATNGRLLTCDRASRATARQLIVSYTGRARQSPPPSAQDASLCVS